MSLSRYSNSPIWSDSSKRLVVLVLLLLISLLLYRVRLLLLPFVMAMVLAYLIDPGVNALSKRLRVPRLVAIILIYLLIIAVLILIPVRAIPPIVVQVNAFLNNVPRYLQELGDFLQQPIIVANFEIPIDDLPLEQLYAGISSNLINIIQTLGGRSLSLLGSIASATISTVGWTVMVLFLSFYLVKDHELMFQAIMDLVPESYKGDIYLLSEQVSITWNAFLRGQLVLCLVMATIVFVLALLLNLPNPLTLALIAGFAEFLPTVGPVLAAVPAALIALFQSDVSWIGHFMTPFWFMVVILSVYGIIFQLENYYLVPRIMGHHLRLHPLVVILGAVAGASVAGLLGILLAAPVLATVRLIFLYIYCKLTDRPPFPLLVVGETAVSATDEEE
ncbi:MAG: AI-2E family transporter [Chloroflexota bacterium]|nr:AI-2E family transporter [Ardenticatenaceae bacterium]